MTPQYARTLQIHGFAVTGAEYDIIQASYDGAFGPQQVQDKLAELRSPPPAVPYGHYDAAHLETSIRLERKWLAMKRAQLRNAVRRLRDLERDADNPAVARHIPQARNGARTVAYIALQTRNTLRLLRAALATKQPTSEAA